MGEQVVGGVIAITNEVLNEKPKRVLMIHSNKDVDESGRLPRFNLRLFSDDKISNATEGSYLEDGGFLSDSFIYPRKKDFIIDGQFGGVKVDVYKLYNYNPHYFDEVSDFNYKGMAAQILIVLRDRYELPEKEKVLRFVYSLFASTRSCRGRTAGKMVDINTPCKDFFHADVDAIDMCIGKMIRERFGLERIYGKFGLSSHCFDVDDDFYKKYPTEELGKSSNTLKKFAEMIYDLVRIKYGLGLIN